MRSFVQMVLTVAVVLSAGVIGPLVAQQQGGQPPTSSARVTPAETTTRIVAAAQALLTTLDGADRAKVQFPFDGPQKTRWSNFPSGMRSSRTSSGDGVRYL